MKPIVLPAASDDRDFNAIDPNLVFDEQGHAWLSFGSFWSGIKMRRIDPKTGMLSMEYETLFVSCPEAAPQSAARSSWPARRLAGD